MYHFSRRIYRELSPLILDERPAFQRETNRELVLHACEAAMERLITDRRYFANPARSLFNDVRIYFSLSSQLRAYMVIKHNIDLAIAFLAKLPENGLQANGLPRRCQAMTRKSKPCQRQPLPRSDYCPSHQHLTESFEEFQEIEGVPLAA
jgi:hypothetical protein